MNKKFKQVVKKKLIKCVVVLSGISFTLFGSASSSGTNTMYESSEPAQVETVVERQIADENSDVKMTLVSNMQTENEQLVVAFEKFRNRFNGESSELRKMFEDIACEFKSIKFDKVSVDGNPKDGKLNIAFRFNDGIILSINKKQGLHKDDMVGFNIIHNRQLLLSDVMSLTRLKEYISNVQKRLV